ncbi:MAG: imidazolonepropionase [Bdellovibrionaceae bacterium]|nr:imidazolonepropionase [Pseudobdellovibrionaceae bacterium]
MVLKCFRKIHELWSFQGLAVKSGRNVKEEDLSLITDGAIICKEGVIEWVGKDSDCNSKVINEIAPGAQLEEVFFKDKIIMPAFVEAHTHSIFAGDRTQEFELRIQGKSYQEIADQGGGILSTVKATRETSKKKLTDLTQERVNRFLSQGVGTLEIKSGYSLDEKGEVKLLQALKDLKGPEIIATYLGPHALSPDMPKHEYQNLILQKILPHIVHHKLAKRVDIFIEKNYYDIEFARNYFSKAKDLGLDIVAHVEQLSYSAGLPLAIEFNAKSVDHIVKMKDSEIPILAQSETTAMLLPAADFYLNIPYPKARQLLDCGARVAIATDFNPGSSPTQDLSFVGLLSRLAMKMTFPETLAAYSLNAAFALGQESRKGSIDIKKQCDFIVLDDNLSSLFMSVGHHPVAEVWLAGELKYKKS